jgi:hypothetical protein
VEGTAEIHDLSAGLTTPVPSRMSLARTHHSAVLLADGNVLLLGGYVMNPQAIEQGGEIFDVNAATFTRIGLTAAARIQPTMTLRADGVVQIFGGDAGKSTEFGSGTPEVSLGKGPRGLGKWERSPSDRDGGHLPHHRVGGYADCRVNAPTRPSTGAIWRGSNVDSKTGGLRCESTWPAFAGPS